MIIYKPVLVAITGGTGSGKSTLSKDLQSRFASFGTTVVQQDDYYVGQDDKTPEEREKINYDHPGIVEFDRLADDLDRLLNGLAVNCPDYDFVLHIRKRLCKNISPARLIILEGMLIMTSSRIMNLADISVFLDVEEDVRLQRKIKRDIIERKRTRQSVIWQFDNFARPMHHVHVEPYKRMANYILNDGLADTENYQRLLLEIKSLLEQKH